MSDEAKKLSDKFGGVWGRHPNFKVYDWRYAVDNGDTRQSYWDWVLAQIEAKV